MKPHYFAYAATLALCVGCASEQDEQRLLRLEERNQALEQKVDTLTRELQKTNEGIATINTTVNPQHEYLRDDQ